MENKIKTLGIAFAMVVGLAACEKSYVEPQPAATSQEELTNDDERSAEALAFRQRITSGAWEITSFQWHIRKEDNTHFKNYVFRFLETNVVVASYNGKMSQGKWRKQGHNFVLIFPSGTLKELNNEKWYINFESPGQFVLKGLSPYDNSSEFVVFKKLPEFLN